MSGGRCTRGGDPSKHVPARARARVLARQLAALGQSFAGRFDRGTLGDLLPSILVDVERARNR